MDDILPLSYCLTKIRCGLKCACINQMIKWEWHKLYRRETKKAFCVINRA
jgi:hypothetical protein